MLLKARYRRVLVKALVPFLAAFLEAPHALPQVRQKTLDEQSDFGSDSSLDRPVPTPKSAIDAIRSQLQSSAEELPDKFFETSEIHLDGPAEVDLVILMPAGSHAAHFFLLRPTSSGYSIILDSGGDSLSVLRTRTRGYRNIVVEGFSQAGRLTTTASYRFNGRKYIQISEKTKRTN